MYEPYAKLFKAIISKWAELMNQVNFSKSVIIRTNPEFIIQINNGNKKTKPSLVNCTRLGFVDS